jgi:hypothetical protein
MTRWWSHMICKNQKWRSTTKKTQSVIQSLWVSKWPSSKSKTKKNLKLKTCTKAKTSKLWLQTSRATLTHRHLTTKLISMDSWLGLKSSKQRSRTKQNPYLSKNLLKIWLPKNKQLKVTSNLTKISTWPMICLTCLSAWKSKEDTSTS